MDCVTEYLRTVSPLVASRLYGQPWAALVLFRALPALAQQITMRIVVRDIGTSVSSSELKVIIQLPTNE